MAAEGVPGQTWVFGAQLAQRGAGQPAPLVFGQGVGLFHPRQAAAAADAVVDGEGLGGVVEVGLRGGWDRILALLLGVSDSVWPEGVADTQQAAVVAGEQAR
jgi:hypothetical protein